MTDKSIDFQIMWNRLIAVVEEQATTLIRTAFSTSVREAGDLSAGLFEWAFCRRVVNDRDRIGLEEFLHLPHMPPS